ncbi:uncharacterized protein A4U43_C05F34980 [Asparagus officinalis]|uniref:Uncharacterized protein n=1 Tax=Asparagus officinalis TaxID=4686 RepID=A0A5P1F1J0_ASPOF|nr:uncharacterized protein A4U43_C05F34980 [Asparagus officinalis]
MRRSKDFRHVDSADAPSTKCVDKIPEIHHREYLRKTMLKHEQIFKHQVTELHRLYRVQKTLMSDQSSNGFSISASTSSTSRSSYLRKDHRHSPMSLNSKSSSPQESNLSKFRNKSIAEDKDFYADGDGEIKLSLSIGR